MQKFPVDVMHINLIDSGRGGSTGNMRMRIIHNDKDGIGLMLVDALSSLRPFITRAVQARWRALNATTETRIHS